MSASQLAQDLVQPAGTGDQVDADLVRAEIDRLPPAELTMLRDKGVKVLACRGSVVDHRPELASVKPRGWPDGYTWSMVPGAYLPDEGSVAIATLSDPQGARYIPPKGVMHSSWNLVIHETMHADDYLGGRLRSHNPDFLSARTADLAALDPYEQQQGAAGYEETYAESAARHFGLDPAFPAAWANLAAFWSARILPVPPGPADRALAVAADHIGAAEVDASGAIRLDLRAESADGALGHALFVIAPETPAHAAITAHLAGGRPRRRAPALNAGVQLVAPFR